MSITTNGLCQSQLLELVQMLSILLISTADTALGRIDIGSLPHEDLFNILTEDIELPLAWYLNTKSDDNGNMTSIAIFRLSGFPESYLPALNTVDFRYAPPTVEHLGWTRMHSTGTVETSSLPQCLKILEIGKNKFYGEFSTEGLPKGMTDVHIYANEFAGSLHLETLPPLVKAFRAHANKFSGCLDFSSLPPGIAFLCLEMNKFTGRVNLGYIPSPLRDLSLHCNLWSDEAVIFNETHAFECVSIDEMFQGKTTGRDGEPFEPKGIEFN